MNTKYSNRNPYIDGQEAREAADKAVSILNTTFNSVQRMKRSSVYLINNSFYVILASAPSSPRFVKSISGIISVFTKLPYYIIFTRELNTYPTNSIDSYFMRIRKLYETYSSRRFKGCVIGIDELDTRRIVDTMNSSNTIPKPDVSRFKDLGAIPSLGESIRSIGITGKQLKELGKLLMEFGISGESRTLSR